MPVIADHHHGPPWFGIPETAVIIAETRVPAVAVLVPAAVPVHFSATPAVSPARLIAFAAMLPAIHSLAAGLSLLVLHVVLLVILLARAGRRRPWWWNDLAATRTSATLHTLLALTGRALAPLALALTTRRSLGEAGAYRKPSQYRTQQENPGYR